MEAKQFWRVKRRMILFAALAVFMVCRSSGQSATLYVDRNLDRISTKAYSIANRNTSGTDGEAYRTIGAAARIAKQGDIVLIRGGTYNSSESADENDILWPKHSGTENSPITFKAYEKEDVVLGDASEKYPAENELSIARAVVTLKDVSRITIEGLTFRKVAGWVFARGCDHITFRNCTFEDALHGAKGTAHFIECHDCRVVDCSFRRASFDSVAIEKCERMLVENCTFDSAAHALLAIRASSSNVIRHCSFANPFFVNGRAEKLVEVYDLKLDKRDPGNPAYMEIPSYNITKRNLFENNRFGYHPFRPNRASQPSAIQYSGQEGIIRRNVFANPTQPGPDATEPQPGGVGLYVRWGGSWDGWKIKANGSGVWWGEGHEAGYVTHNRVYNNVFFGYDQACITLPAENAMAKILNPPPMNEANPPVQFSDKFAFEDNRFVNNIIAPGPYQAHFNWKWQQVLTGKPVAVVAFGLVGKIHFRNNDFYAADGRGEAEIYFHQLPSTKARPEIVASAARIPTDLAESFADNLTRSPDFVNAESNDFHLKEKSPLIDAGAFLTTALGENKGTELKVSDVSCFFDGFEIEGEKGDQIQLQGQTETARIVHIDYKSKMLKLDRALSWKNGQGVSLVYSGAAPDIGVFEAGLAITVGAADQGRPAVSGQ
ncbi:MAG: right-handed parallel beta-helix repeat-containing protein [Candidatus Udaeobacter sp.]